MYTIRRSKTITEQLALLYSDGTVADILDVSVDVDTITADYFRCRDALVNADKKLREARSKGETGAFYEAYSRLGSAVADYFSVIFGKENTCRIIEFYEGKYVEMLAQVVPFINEKFAPAIGKAKELRIKQLKRIKR